jgi:hypothetical protein
MVVSVVEWLGNALKTLSESDSRRLRRLETTVMEIQDDGEKFLRLAERINARLRGRANRERASADDEPGGRDDVQSDSGTGPVGAQSGPALVAQKSEVTYTKEQLRGFARAKGIRA